MNACHLIFHMTSSWLELAMLIFYTAACFLNFKKQTTTSAHTKKMFQWNSQLNTYVHLETILTLVGLFTFPTGSDVKHYSLNVWLFPSLPLELGYNDHFSYSSCCIDHQYVCVCSIAEGCTLKLVLAMRGGPINTRRGKERANNTL